MTVTNQRCFRLASCVSLVDVPSKRWESQSFKTSVGIPRNLRQAPIPLSKKPRPFQAKLKISPPIETTNFQVGPRTVIAHLTMALTPALMPSMLSPKKPAIALVAWFHQHSSDDPVPGDFQITFSLVVLEEVSLDDLLYSLVANMMR